MKKAVYKNYMSFVRDIAIYKKKNRLFLKEEFKI